MQQDLLRQAGGDESLIAEMRSNVRNNSLLYQMASEELRRDSNRTTDVEENGVGAKRMREELTDMAEISKVAAKNMKSALDDSHKALDVTQKLTLELEKQAQMRSKERKEIVEIEQTRMATEQKLITIEQTRMAMQAQRQADELKFVDAVYTKKIHYERQLKEITAPQAPVMAAVPAAIETKPGVILSDATDEQSPNPININIRLGV